MRKALDYFILISYLLITTLPIFMAVDRIGAQWFYLSCLNLFGLVYILNIFNISLIKENLKTFNSPLFLFIAFLTWMLLSIIGAENKIESSVVIVRWINIFIAIIISTSILYKHKNPFKMIAYLLSVFLLLETIITLIQYADIYENLNQSSRDLLKGFTGNKNINAASILFKLPFLIWTVKWIKFPFIKIAGVSVIIFVNFLIILIGARSMILAMFIVYTIFIFHVLYKTLKHKSYIKSFKNFIFYIVPLIFGIILSNTLIKNQDFKINSNVERIVEYNQSQSATDRLRFFGQALQSYFENPLFGSGIGNWKIVSLKYDSKEMMNYVVQFNVHNDFLELLAEIGLGVIFYILIFIFSIIFLLKKYFQTLKLKYIILISVLGVYIIDSNLNFPMMRVITQVNFILLISLLIILTSKSYYVEK